MSDFSKEEIIMFNETVAGFNDMLSITERIGVWSESDVTWERSDNVIRRPVPYIVPSFDGTDMTNNFNGQVQLTVPAVLDTNKSVPWILEPGEARDSLQQDRLRTAAMKRLASDINIKALDVATLQGTLVVPISTAAGTYDDIAQADSIMNETGVDSMYDRYFGLNSRDYNGMAGDLAQASRSFGNKTSDNALQKGVIPNVADFEMFKMDYSNSIPAAGGSSLTIDTQAAASNYYTPISKSTAATGQTSNVDNRYQVVTISATTNVVAGDCFTIAGIDGLSHQSKRSSAQLKTFRVISVDSGTTMTISPPIVSNQGGSQSEIQYKNVEVTESATAAIVFLNTTAALANPFWSKDAIELLPGRYASPSDAGTPVLRDRTENGIEVEFSKFYDINTKKIKYRVDTFFGVTMCNPEMAGILLFGQV